MRRWVFGWIMGVLAFAPCVSAQLQVRLGAERDNYIQHEPIIIDTYLISRNAGAIVLGDHDGWIRFSVRNGRGIPVRINARMPRGNLFVLGRGRSLMRTFNLEPYFDFSEPGEYTIQASVANRNWTDLRFESAPVKIQVVRGRVLQERQRGMPAVRPGEPPEVRRYTLLTTRVKGKSNLFLRVTDHHQPPRVIYNVAPLGVMVHQARPRFGLDSDGMSHVFFQSHGQHYFYCQVDGNGELRKRETYARGRGAPDLQVDPIGRFLVVGGERQVAVTDYPAPINAKLGGRDK